MADKEIKFSQEEMTQISELQDTYAGLQNALGQFGVARIRLEQQMADLDANEDQIKSQYNTTQQKERDFVATINKKYGDGNLDLGTGVFTPKPAAAPADKTL